MRGPGCFPLSRAYFALCGLLYTLWLSLYYISSMIGEGGAEWPTLATTLHAREAIHAHVHAYAEMVLPRFCSGIAGLTFISRAASTTIPTTKDKDRFSRVAPIENKPALGKLFSTRTHSYATARSLPCSTLNPNTHRQGFVKFTRLTCRFLINSSLHNAPPPA